MRASRPTTCSALLMRAASDVLEMHEVGDEKFFKLRVDQGGGPAADHKNLTNGRVFECFQEHTFAD